MPLEEPSLARSTPAPEDPAKVRERSAFRQRLKTYLFGVAIGLPITALIIYNNWQQRQARNAAAGTPPAATAPSP